MRLDDHFQTGLHPDWCVTEIGAGQVRPVPGALWLTLPPSGARPYSDAQIADYASKRDFRWRPPVRMRVTARAEGDLKGTAGFGFWNHPFVPGERGFRLPSAVWFFFSSPPSDMRLACDVPGPGWKAATFDARRWQFFALLPAALPGVLLMRIPALYRRLWPIGQHAIGVSEHLLDARLLNATHTYTLDWRRDGVTFAVDGETVHESDCAPGGPLGFVAWVDNQYAVVTPQGRIGFGTVDVPGEQSLVLDSVEVTG